MIQGNLNSTPLSAFHLEFFANAACSASGFGEGKIFIGPTNLTTDVNGNAGFSASFPAAGAIITATATDTNNNTSEFSACTQVAAPCTLTCPANITVTNTPGQ